MRPPARDVPRPPCPAVDARPGFILPWRWIYRQAHCTIRKSTGAANCLCSSPSATIVAPHKPLALRFAYSLPALRVRTGGGRGASVPRPPGAGVPGWFGPGRRLGPPVALRQPSVRLVCGRGAPSPYISPHGLYLVETSRICDPQAARAPFPPPAENALFGSIFDFLKNWAVYRLYK